MRRLSSKILPAIVLALILLAAIPLCKYAIRTFNAHKRQHALAKIDDEIARDSGIDQISDVHSKLDSLRVYINDNSRHNMDAEFYTIWPDKIRLAQNMLNYIRHVRTTPPHMECSTRADLLGDIMKLRGYKIRNIVLYNVHHELVSHRVVDIFNSETGRWETQDPDFDVYWIHKSDGVRSSIADVMVNSAEYLPCGRTGCGWSHTSSEGIKVVDLLNYIGLITVDDRNADKRVTLYAPSTDPAQTYKNGEQQGVFCTIIPKECRNGFLPAKSYSN